jgi:peptide/nickel transport system substrate-binding protein
VTSWWLGSHGFCLGVGGDAPRVTVLSSHTEEKAARNGLGSATKPHHARQAVTLAAQGDAGDSTVALTATTRADILARTRKIWRRERIMAARFSGWLERGECTRPSHLGGLLLTLGLLLPTVACGAGNGGGGGETNGGAAIEELRFASATATPSDILDPVRQLSNFEIVAVGAIYDSLVEIDNEFVAHPGIIEEWEVDDEGVEWTLNLRDGVKFHDDTPVTSQDVVYSIQRNLDPEGTSPVVGLLGPYLSADDVEAVDESTVRLTLSSPYAFIPVALGNRYMRVIKAGADNFDEPVGTGPYVFEAHTPGQSLSVVRNEDYWGETAQFARIDSENIPEASSRVAALMAGNADAVESIDYSQVPTVEDSDDHQLVVLENTYIPAVDLDLSVEPFDDPRVVKAIKLSLDREQLIETVFQGQGSVGYDTPVASSDPRFASDMPEPARDLEEARRLLAEAGYPDGFSHEFFVSPVGPSMLEFGVAVSEQLADAGIDFKVRQWPEATFWDNVWLSKSTSTPIYIRRHPDEILTYLATCEGPWNGTSWCDEDFDAAVEGARSILDEDAQNEEYAAAQRLHSEGGGHLMPAFTHLVAGASQDAPIGTSPISLIDFDASEAP